MKLKELLEASRMLPEYTPVKPPKGTVKLNANENLFLDESLMQDALEEASAATDPRLYPDSEGDLIKALAELHGVKPGNILVASGGDQVIDIVVGGVLCEGEEVLAVSPTFSMYPWMAKVKRRGYREVPLGSGFRLDPGKVLDSVADETGLLVLCNPNNPTGNQFKREHVLELADGFDSIVLVDEAYAEFSEYSLVDEAATRDDLLVLRTFSKAYGLAGLRLGYMIGGEGVVSALRRFLMPYSVSSLSLNSGLAMLKRREAVQDAVDEAKQEREWLTGELSKVKGVTVFPSQTNFILFDTGRSCNDVYEGLLNRGVLVRKTGKVPGYQNCLRVTVAPRRLSERFLESLKEVQK